MQANSAQAGHLAGGRHAAQTAGAKPDVPVAGGQSDAQIDAPTNDQAGSLAGAQTEAQASAQADIPAGARAGARPDMQPHAETNAQTGTQSDGTPASPRRRSKKRAGAGRIGFARLRPLLAALIILAAAALVSELTRPYRPDNPVDEFIDRSIGRDWAESELDTVETGDVSYEYVEMPADSGELDGLLYITGARTEYEDGAMALTLPKLGIADMPVSDGTARADLKVGPGLFEYSNMPGEGDRNVSIAGHRSRKFFYDLDKVGEGDALSLVYGSLRFDYVYLDTKVILPTDWSVIQNQGFSCCTLITCTPVGVANRRMVVRFSLESITPLDEPAPDAPPLDA